MSEPAARRTEIKHRAYAAAWFAAVLWGAVVMLDGSAQDDSVLFGRGARNAAWPVFALAFGPFLVLLVLRWVLSGRWVWRPFGPWTRATATAPVAVHARPPTRSLAAGGRAVRWAGVGFVAGAVAVAASNPPSPSAPVADEIIRVLAGALAVALCAWCAGRWWPGRG